VSSPQTPVLLLIGRSRETPRLQQGTWYSQMSEVLPHDLISRIDCRRTSCCVRLLGAGARSASHGDDDPSYDVRLPDAKLGSGQGADISMKAARVLVRPVAGGTAVPPMAAEGGACGAGRAPASTTGRRRASHYRHSGGLL
jgi:hypothetical protein